jgi:xylose isomerase
MAADIYEPRPEDRFSFGLWTVGNRGRDPFGDAVRPPLAPAAAVRLLAEAGAWGVNFHDDDLVPIGATASERGRIVREFRAVLGETGVVVPMATVNLFYDPAFRDGAFTANDPRVRAYAVQKALRAMELGAEFGARLFVLWGGREGSETDACRRPDEALKRLREAVDFLCHHSESQGYGYRFALEAKPNEPRADIYLPTTGACLHFITTLGRPDLVGVNPEVAHEHMAGLNVTHAVAQAWEAGKLFHIDLNDQVPGRYDQDLRFGSANPKAAFWLVKFLEGVGYAGPRHFDSHAYRTEDYGGVREFARGSMRTYLILKEKARRWGEHPGVKALLAEMAEAGGGEGAAGGYTPGRARALLAREFDRGALAAGGLGYERLDQLTTEILLGVA